MSFFAAAVTFRFTPARGGDPFDYADEFPPLAGSILAIMVTGWRLRCPLGSAGAHEDDHVPLRAKKLSGLDPVGEAAT